MPAARRRFADPIPAPSRHRSARWIAALAAVAVLVVGGVVVAVTWSGSGDSTTSSEPTPSSTDLDTAAGLGRLLDEIQQNFGDSVVDDLDVYPEYARFTRQVPGKPGMAQSYRYEVDHGKARFTESGSPSSRSTDMPVDLSPLRPQVPRLIGLLYGADRSLAVADPTTTHISVKHGEHRAEARLYLRNEDLDASGSLTMAFDGEILEVRRADR